MGENKKRLSIGNIIAKEREKMGLTQEEFADKFGYARTTLAKLEAGIRDIKSTEIVTLAKQLNVSCDYLLCRTDDVRGNADVMAVEQRLGLDPEAQDALLSTKDLINELSENIKNVKIQLPADFGQPILSQIEIVNFLIKTITNDSGLNFHLMDLIFKYFNFGSDKEYYMNMNGDIEKYTPIIGKDGQEKVSPDQISFNEKMMLDMFLLQINRELYDMRIHYRLSKLKDK